MNPDSVPQEFYEDAAARDASSQKERFMLGFLKAADERLETTISYRLQTLIGRCMSLETDLHRAGDLVSEGIILEAREKIVEVAARLEIPVEVKE